MYSMFSRGRRTVTTVSAVFCLVVMLVIALSFIFKMSLTHLLAK